MKLLAVIRNKLGGIANAIIRFPATFLLLLCITTIISVTIETGEEYNVTLISLAFAVFCFLAAQVLSERFAKKMLTKVIFYVAAAVAAAVDYLLVRNAGEVNTIVLVNTAVAVFALLIAFIWIPSIKGNADFNVVFMSFFKSFFTSAFYTGVLWGGISLILIAIDTLLVRLNENLFAHIAIALWIVWAPMLLLSLIPVFGEDDAENEKIKKASVYPKFLEIVLSYILVPLASVYTFVLILYIIKTVISGSWNDNLLEPLMLSYCIAILLLYILLSRLENRFALFFLKIFPIFLTLIALFQIVSSSITISSLGIVHSRYFVVMFGLYSVICGILLFILPVKKNGIVAVLAICFALVCITPYISAFSVSIASQTSLIENTLEKNNMLSDNKVIANPGIPENDKLAISSSAMYLSNIGKNSLPAYLPDNFSYYDNFEKTFGFEMQYGFSPGERFDQYYTLGMFQPMAISGFDYMTNLYFNMPESRTQKEDGAIDINGSQYHLNLTLNGFKGTVKITDEDKNELISVPLEELFDKIALITPAGEKGIVPVDSMTFDYENDAAKIRLIVNNANIFNSSSDRTYFAECYVMFTIK
ncbi:MAG: DUF4153 domain-containing protein [Eubacteriales bacterium]